MRVSGTVVRKATIELEGDEVDWMIQLCRDAYNCTALSQVENLARDIRTNLEAHS